VRVPEDPQERFPAVVRAADELLAVMHEAPEEVAPVYRPLIRGPLP
jgi:hypothetical protein